MSAYWFPDGEKLLMSTRSVEDGTAIWVASILGGAPRKLRADCHVARISSDGKQIAFVTGKSQELWTMGANGEDARKILAIDSGYIFGLDWSPTGQRIAYAVEEPNGSGVNLMSVAMDGKAPMLAMKSTQLTDQSPGFEWAPDGRFFFTRSDSSTFSASALNLAYLRIDPNTGKASQEPAKMTHWDGVWPEIAGLTKDGKRLLVMKVHVWNDVFLGELRNNGTQFGKVNQFTTGDSNDAASWWSLDSKSLLFDSDRTGGRTQIYRQAIGQGSPVALFPGPEDQISAEVTPDGAWILYWTSPHSSGNSPTTTETLMRAPAEGGAAERILDGPYDSATGSHCGIQANSACVLSLMAKGQLVFYSLDPLKGQGKEIARTQVGDAGLWLGWAISADAKHIAVSGFNAAGKNIRIIDLQTDEQREIPAPGLPLGAVSWSSDGRAIYGVAQGNVFYLFRADLSGTFKILQESPLGQYFSSPLASPDGHFLAFSRQSGQENAFLVENF